MGKLSAEVKALRAKERADKRALAKKKASEVRSAINAQRVRRKMKLRAKKRSR